MLVKRLVATYGVYAKDKARLNAKLVGGFDLRIIGFSAHTN